MTVGVPSFAGRENSFGVSPLSELCAYEVLWRQRCPSAATRASRLWKRCALRRIPSREVLPTQAFDSTARELRMAGRQVAVATR
jgi:hypothetical protein